MRRDLIEILVCPSCKISLNLEVSIEGEAGVISGSLDCPQCLEKYPIENSIPNLLPSSMRS
jgi:uncharacterized protein YbaR (Trm112 family)